MMERDKEMKALNTFGIEAKARWFAEYQSVEELMDVLRCVRNEAPDVRLLHVGQGSNLLFLCDYDGLVLHCGLTGIEVLKETADSVTIRVGAGKVWDELVAEAIDKGWYGLENLTAIPGEVGAAAVQNIGAYGSEVKDFICQVNVMNLSTYECTSFSNAEMEYGYRHSVLKRPDVWGRFAVTSVDLQLSKTFVPKLEYGGLQKAVADRLDNGEAELTAAELREIVRATRDGKLPDPKVLGNAGSFFMNPVVGRDVYERLAAQYENMPHYEVDAEHVKIPAGWLIEKAGWKGKSLGRAGVYEKQALVLVNLGGATGQDIVRLCEKVQADVLEKFGVAINPEVNFIK